MNIREKMPNIAGRNEKYCLELSHPPQCALDLLRMDEVLHIKHIVKLLLVFYFY